jgi:aminoglycoside phosphotransferase (APT) family kinase protein
VVVVLSTFGFARCPVAIAVEPQQVLADCFPDLADHQFTVAASGLDNLVLDVAGGWIVRLPRRANIQQHFAGEVALLAELADVLSVPVPRPELSIENPTRAMRYRKLPGTRLDEHLDGPHRLRLASRLGRFLGELHDFPTSRARKLGVRAYNPPSWLEQFRIFYANARLHAFPLLTPRERRQATDLIESHVVDGAKLSFTPSLMHGDLAPEHVLCKTAGLITGVIDWTDARIGDPAVDLAWLAHGTESDFAGAVLASYPANDPAMVERARFYYQVVPWHVLLFGIDEHRAELIESGLADVRERLG